MFLTPHSWVHAYTYTTPNAYFLPLPVPLLLSWLFSWSTSNLFLLLRACRLARFGFLFFGSVVGPSLPAHIGSFRLLIILPLHLVSRCTLVIVLILLSSPNFPPPLCAVVRPSRGPAITCDDHVGEWPYNKGKLLNLQVCSFWVCERSTCDFRISKLGTVSALGQFRKMNS